MVSKLWENRNLDWDDSSLFKSTTAEFAYRDHEKPQSREPIPRQKFKPRTTIGAVSTSSFHTAAQVET